ncbi:MAG: glutamine synthetase III, partial [Rectinema sp.]
MIFALIFKITTEGRSLARFRSMQCVGVPMSETFDLTENPVSSLYGSNCFSNGVMRERLPQNVYKEILAVQAGEKELTLEVADVVAA